MRLTYRRTWERDGKRERKERVLAYWRIRSVTERERGVCLDNRHYAFEPMAWHCLGAFVKEKLCYCEIKRERDWDRKRARLLLQRTWEGVKGDVWKSVTHSTYLTTFPSMRETFLESQPIRIQSHPKNVPRKKNRQSRILSQFSASFLSTEITSPFIFVAESEGLCHGQ